MSLGLRESRYGNAVRKESRVVPLWWQECRVVAPTGWRDALRAASAQLRGRAGVYCFEGSHDARPSPGPLYIGRTDADFGERLSIKGSLGHFFYRGEHDSLASYSDVWNLVLRWAVTESTIVSDVEMVLIRAHKPNYNAKDIKGSLDGDLLVLNTGAKGHLLPVVSEWYFAPAPEWPTE